MFGAISRFFRRLGTYMGIAAVAASGSSNPRLGPAGSMGVVHEPNGITQDDWNPGLVKAAYRMAERGDLRLVSDFADTLLGDDRCAAVWGTRADGLLGAEQSFEPSSYRNKKRKNAAIKAIDAGEDWWAMFPEEELRKLLIYGRLVGVSFARIILERSPDHGDRIIPRIEVWSARWFRYNFETHGWERTDGRGNWFAIAPGDSEWVIYLPYGAKRPWAFGLWRGLAVPYLLKRCAQIDWGNYSEQHGRGTWVVTGANTKERRQEIANLFAQLGRNPSVAVDTGLTVELIEAQANTWENFDAQIRACNVAFAVTVIGGNLAAEVTAGQQTGATAQTLVRIDYKRADASSLASCTHDQVLRYWAQWNFGDSRLAPWPQWDVEPPEDDLQTANTWAAVARSAKDFRDAGYELDVEEVEAEFGIPLRKIAVPVEPDKPPTESVEPSNDDDQNDTKEAA